MVISKSLLKIVLFSIAILSSVPIQAASWQPSWSAAIQPVILESSTDASLNHHTLRQIIHLHQSGQALRLHFSNRFGKDPVILSHITVANQKSGAAISAPSLRRVSFNQGQSTIIIAPGAEVISDMVRLSVTHLQNLAVSLYVEHSGDRLTGHPNALQENFIAPADQSTQVGAESYRQITRSWFWISQIEVLTQQPSQGTIVLFGDDLTNGNHSTMNNNHRWPDYLMQRIDTLSSKHHFIVLNEGSEQEQLLHDNKYPGTSGLARLQRDILAKGAIRTVILLEGTQDILIHQFPPQQLINGFMQAIEQLHTHHIQVLLGTLPPFKGADKDNPQREKTRMAVNQWIRTNHLADGIIDFAKALQDKAHPLTLAAEYDAGDHWHLNDLGYQKMAQWVPIEKL